jgi:hypothetical protein
MGARPKRRTALRRVRTVLTAAAMAGVDGTLNGTGGTCSCRHHPEDDLPEDFQVQEHCQPYHMDGPPHETVPAGVDGPPGHGPRAAGQNGVPSSAAATSTSFGQATPRWMREARTLFESDPSSSSPSLRKPKSGHESNGGPLPARGVTMVPIPGSPYPAFYCSGSTPSSSPSSASLMPAPLSAAPVTRQEELAVRRYWTGLGSHARRALLMQDKAGLLAWWRKYTSCSTASPTLISNGTVSCPCDYCSIKRCVDEAAGFALSLLNPFPLVFP